MVLQAGGPLTKWIEHKPYAVLKNLTAPAAPSGCSLAQIKEKLVSHFKPKPPVTAERFSFHKHAGEVITDFVIELRRLACMCNLRSSEGSLGMWNDKQQQPEEAADQKRTYLTKSY